MKTPKEISVTLDDVLKILDEQIKEVTEMYKSDDKKGNYLLDPDMQIRSVLSHTQLKFMELCFKKN